MTPHPDHQRRVEELLDKMADAATSACAAPPSSFHSKFRPFAERLARAEAHAERLAVAEGAATNDCIQAQSDAQSWRQAAEHWMREAQRLRAQPLDEGLRERVIGCLSTIEWIVKDAPSLDPMFCPSCRNVRVQRHAGDCRLAALLRDLRTAPALQEPTANLPIHPEAVAHDEMMKSYRQWEAHTAAPTPTLTDRERLGRLERIVVSSANDYAGHCRALHQFHVGDAVEWQGDVGELARELASRSEKESE